MNDPLDTMLVERFTTQRDPLPGADLRDVHERAARLLVPVQAGRLRLPRRRVLLTLAAVLVVVGGGTAALARTFLIGNGTRPITATSVSALQQLPPPSNPPVRLLDDIKFSTNHIGGNPIRALETLRLVGGDLGTTHTDLYAYDMGPTPHSHGRDVLCLFVWDRGGACQANADSLFPDILLDISPGGPGYRGLPADTPPTIAGLVADDVTRVALIENGQQKSLPITNNSFFAELDESPQTAFTVTLHFTYKDGSSKDWDYHQE